METCEICGKELTNKRWTTPVCSSECFEKHFWNSKVARKKDKRQVVINHKVYYIANENIIGERGFDGAVFYIGFFDGRKVKTTNLWCNGEMPEAYYSKLPDNARFLTREEFGDTTPIRTEQDVLHDFLESLGGHNEKDNR